jgi:NitT/TauT family transport system substrate-binding protein
VTAGNKQIMSPAAKLSFSRTRRRVVRALAAGIGVGLCVGGISPARAEPQLETKRIRLCRNSGLCVAPQYLAEELLRAEGFTEVEYVPETAEIGTSKLVASGAADINLSFALSTLMRVDAGEPIVLLGGVHVGCYELFGNQAVRTVRDLKNRRIAVLGPGSTHQLFLSSILSYVGIDPRRDVKWVVTTRLQARQLLSRGDVDAYLGFPPDPQEMREDGIGHVLLNSATDKPWSQYFCCTVAGNRDFVSKFPVATKRALRAILKATDLCAAEPARAAKFLLDHGYAASFQSALRTMQDVPYRNWRDYNPEDTVRFYGLRLQEVGMIKATPDRLIAQGTDWRFLNELKKELKA